MNNLTKGLVIVFVCVAVCLVGAIIGYSIITSDKNESLAKVEEESNVLVSAVNPLTITQKDDSHVKTILPHTLMVYEYVYKDDGAMEVAEETAPYFMLNMNEEKLKERFEDWEVITFSPEKVVMRKTIDGISDQHYVVSVQDGYITVFYQNPVNGTTLKEVTETPISSLSEDDRYMLEQGVLVSGEEELIRILEDYSS